MQENFNFQKNSLLSEFEPISLEDIDSKNFLNRQEKKFIFHTDLFPTVISEMKSNYGILNINNFNVFNYKTIYYDTDNLDFYVQHHNGKQNRYKVRSRYYRETNQTFFELKFKTNKAKTNKKRIFIKDGEDGIIDFRKEIASNDINDPIVSVKNSLEQNLDFQLSELMPRLIINYSRITLLNNTINEKVTFDFNIRVMEIKSINDSNIINDNEINFNNLVIAETKQERIVGMSDFEKIMYHHHIQQMSISKYCTGTILTHPQIKHNRFKMKMKYIHKIIGNNNGI